MARDGEQPVVAASSSPPASARSASAAQASAGPPCCVQSQAASPTSMRAPGPRTSSAGASRQRRTLRELAAVEAEDERDVGDGLQLPSLVGHLLGQLAGAAQGDLGAPRPADSVNSTARASTPAASARSCGSVEPLQGLRQVLARGRAGGQGLGEAELRAGAAAARRRDGGSRSARGRYATALSVAPRRRAPAAACAAARHHGRSPRAGASSSCAATASSGAPSSSSTVAARRVRQLPLGGRQLVVDRVAHQRVHEAERRLGLQDLDRGERARGLRHGPARRAR